MKYIRTLKRIAKDEGAHHYSYRGPTSSGELMRAVLRRLPRNSDYPRRPANSHGYALPNSPGDPGNHRIAANHAGDYAWNQRTAHKSPGKSRGRSRQEHHQGRDQK